MAIIDARFGVAFPVARQCPRQGLCAHHLQLLSNGYAFLNLLSITVLIERILHIMSIFAQSTIYIKKMRTKAACHTNFSSLYCIYGGYYENKNSGPGAGHTDT